MTDKTTRRIEWVKALRPKAKVIRELGSGDMNDMIVVDETEVFRFPRSEESRLRLQYESRVLRKLNERLGVGIPKLLETSEAGEYSVLGYIEGKVLSNQAIANLSDETKDHLTSTLAEFMLDLNKQLDIDELQRWSRQLLPDAESWDEYYDQLYEQSQNEHAVRYRARYEHVKQLQGERVLPLIAIHGDLHAGNMLFRDETLAAVIDFGDCEAGTIYNELRPLMSLGEDIAASVVQKLDGRLGDIDMEYLKQFFIMHELSVLARSNDDELEGSRRVQIAREQLQQFGELDEPVRAIIFDCFGVLTSEYWISFRRKYFPDESASRYAKKMMGDFVNGRIGAGEFVRAIAAKASVGEPEVARSLTSTQPDEELFAWIREHKAHYKIAMLSNVGNDRLHTIFRSEQLELFDEFFLSFREGVAKPQPEAYLRTAARLGVAPEQCVFIDDKEIYCSAARAVGMHAIQYHDFAQFAHEITAILSSHYLES